MIHKKINILFLLAAIAFNSCDTVDGPYGIPTGSTGGSGDSIVKKVLLEDFTGHTCVYCPDSHREAARLKTIYGDRLAVLSVHSGYFAKPQVYPDSSFSYDFRNPISTAIATDFGVINLSYPKGMIDRANNSSGNKILEWASWESAVADRLNQPAVAGLKITNTYLASSRTITSSIETKIVKNITNNVKLAVYFVEDSVIKWQKDNTSIVEFYVHRDVLRGSLNGVYGDDLGANLTTGTTINKTFSDVLTPLDADASKTYIYAILTDAVTKEVLQVEVKKLIP